MKRCLLVILLAATPSVFAEELTKEKFQQLHTALQPGDDELWRTIPWQTSLLSAQAMAAEQKKPLFIWAMDGHPLGCT